MPRSSAGKWSVGLLVAFFLSLVSLRTLVAFGEEGGEKLFSNPALAVTGILAGASAVLAFVAGISSILRSRERSPLVFVAAAIGLLVLLFLLGEVLDPH